MDKTLLRGAGSHATSPRLQPLTSQAPVADPPGLLLVPAQSMLYGIDADLDCLSDIELAPNMWPVVAHLSPRWNYYAAWTLGAATDVDGW
jgi:hypothetical protein